MVLFGAADDQDPVHQSAKHYLNSLEHDKDLFVPSFALVEFDVVLKSRGLDCEQRKRLHALLMSDYPLISNRCLPITPIVLYHTTRLEDEYELEYFDSGVVAQSLLLDRCIVTTDKRISAIKEVETVWKD